MKISYAIPVCNEHVELEKLLSFLLKHIDENDEIVVQCDQGNTTHEVHKVLGTFKAPKGLKDPLKVITFPLNGHFSNFKNNLKELLKLNTNTEMLLVPRVNTVEGITQEHINKWRWNINEKGWVNWPYYKQELYKIHQKLNGKIKFMSK